MGEDMPGSLLFNNFSSMPNTPTRPTLIYQGVSVSPILAQRDQARKLVHSDEIRFRPKRKRDLKWYLDIIVPRQTTGVLVLF